MPEITAAEITQAANVLAKTALRLKAGERFVVVCDAESAEVGNAIAAAGEAAGASVTLARIDILRSVSTNHSGERPHKVLPDLVRRAMLAAQASAFVASAPHQELSMREQLLHIVGACNVRHAHMPGISRRAFARGLSVEFDVIERLGKQVLRKVEGARQLSAESAAGTKLVVTLPEQRRWVPHLGMIAPGTSVAFPTGALYTAPENVRGTFVANACLGEFFGAREGLLIQTPVRFVIDEGIVERVEAPHSPQLQSEIEAILSVAANSNRVGLVAIGVNAGLEVPTGDATVDHTLPGLHLVIGDPAGRVTGMKWSARTSFLACEAGSSVIVQAARVVDTGRLTAA